MNRPCLTAATATLIFAASSACAASPASGYQRGDVYEIVRDQQMSQKASDGSTGSSHDRDRLRALVVAVQPDGLELEYDLPENATPQDRARAWQFPARVFKTPNGPMRLLNAAQLEARVDVWLKAADLTRASCGQWTVTWTAFQIQCDPQSVIGTLGSFDLDVLELRDGATVQDSSAARPGALKSVATGAAGSTFTAQMPVDPDAINRARAESDVVVATLLKTPLTLEAARRERAKDVVSGTITVNFDANPDGQARRRTKITTLETRRPNGLLDTQVVTETTERRPLSRAKP